jgi:hypothetical protein
MQEVVGSNPRRDMSVLGALVEDGDDLGQVSPEYCISYKYRKNHIMHNDMWGLWDRSSLY